MAVEACLDALKDFALARLFWHHRKLKKIKADIEKCDYPPGRMFSDWYECWSTTVDDWYKSTKAAYGQLSTIVFFIDTAFDGEATQHLPIFVMPGTNLRFTQISPPDRITPRDFHVDCDIGAQTVTLSFDPAKAGGPIAEGTYQTYLCRLEEDAEPTALAAIVVDVRRAEAEGR